MTDNLKIAIVDAERDVLNMDISIDKIEAEDVYVPRHQERNSIKVAIDGVEMMIDKDNCNATVLELFEKVVYDRQVEKIVRYLTSKYPHGYLTHKQAKHEMLVTEYKHKDLYEFSEIAEVIALDVVGQ